MSSEALTFYQSERLLHIPPGIFGRQSSGHISDFRPKLVRKLADCAVGIRSPPRNDMRFSTRLLAHSQRRLGKQEDHCDT